MSSLPWLPLESPAGTRPCGGALQPAAPSWVISADVRAAGRRHLLPAGAAPVPVQAATPQGGPLTAGQSQPWHQGPSVAAPSPGPRAACLPGWAGLGASPALMLPAPQGSAGPARASREAGMLSRPQGLGLPEGSVPTLPGRGSQDLSGVVILRRSRSLSWVHP